MTFYSWCQILLKNDELIFSTQMKLPEKMFTHSLKTYFIIFLLTVAKSPHSLFCHVILCSLYQIRISMDEGLKYVSNVTPWRSCSCIYFLLSRTKYFYIFEKRNGLLCVTFSHIISLRRSSSKATKSLNIINVSNVSTFFILIFNEVLLSIQFDK